MTRKDATTPLAATQEALMDAPDLLREIVRSALQEILEAQMTEHVGAERHERTDSRNGQRNGYKPRTLSTRVGAMTLIVPQDRDGTHLEQAVRPLPKKREGAGAGTHGDVCGRRLDPQGLPGHRGAVWDELFQVHDLRAVQATRCRAQRMADSAFVRSRMALPVRRRPLREGEAGVDAS